jgi:hypothetical protein
MRTNIELDDALLCQAIKNRVTPAKAGAHVEIWIPAFPTDLVRGLKAHGSKTRPRLFCGFHDPRDDESGLDTGLFLDSFQRNLAI